MILGEYKHAKNEVTVEIEVEGDRGRETLTAVLDTGFTGFLMLPLALASELRLARGIDAPVELGDGERKYLPTCEATVFWHGKARSVAAYIAPRADALIGMKLLRGSLVTLELVSGGSVTVEPAG